MRGNQIRKCFIGFRWQCASHSAVGDPYQSVSYSGEEHEKIRCTRNTRFEYLREGFDDVADEIQISTKKNSQPPSVNNTVDKSGNIDYLDSLIESQNSKKKKSVLKGIYFSEDIAETLDKLGEKGGRGTRSKIVNEVVRKVFKEKGLL